MHQQVELQRIPVKVYRSDDRLVVAAPMAGLQAEDVVVEVTADGRLLLHGELRGVLKDVKEVLLDEWDVGAYHRALELPVAVDGELSTVTYGNGVVVVSLPVIEHMRAARLTVTPVGPNRGERVGSVGTPPRPTTTEEHRAAKASVQKDHGAGEDPHVS